MSNLSLRWILEESGLSNVSCVCGKEYLDNEITGVQIMDNPDTIKYHKEGDVVLTTGYLLQSNPIFRKTFISELANRKCSGILFKTNRFFEQVPSDIIGDATKHSLPIIELPFNYALSEINMLLMQQIISSKESHAQKTLDLVRNITYSFLLTSNWSDGFSLLAKYLNNPVLIFSPSFKLDYYGLYGDQLSHLGVNNISADNCHIINTQNLLPTEVATDTIFSNIKLQIGSSERIGDLWPILDNGSIISYLCIVNLVSTNNIFTNEDVKLIIPTVSLALNHHLDSKQTIMNIDNQNLKHILHDSYVTKEEISNICQMYNLSDGMNYACICIQSTESSPAKFNEIRSLIRANISDKHLRIYFYQEKNVLDCLIYSISNVADTKELLQYISSTLKSICINEISQNIYIGIGSFHNQLADIHQSFLEAQKSIFLGSKLSFHSPVFLYEDQLIFHTIYNTMSREELEKIVDAALSSLIKYDADNNSNLLSSLVMLVLHQWNLKESASALYIHRNTICYRKDQIVNILHLDMQNAHQLNFITLAVYCHIVLEWYYNVTN